MGFFDRFYYGKAGKRDYTEMDMPSNRVSLFFLVFKERFFDLIKVNLLQVVFWLPFIFWTIMNFLAIQSLDASVLQQEGGMEALTGEVSSFAMMWLIGLIPCLLITGPSSAGSAYIMRNWARDQHVFLFSDFKDAFKSNWKQALVVSAVTCLMPLVAYTALLYYGQLASSNLVMVLPLIVVFSAAFVWTLMLPLLYPMMIGYELSLKHLLKNAMLMAVASLPKIVLSRIITFIPIVLLLVGLYIGNSIIVLVVLFYYLLFGFALSRLVYASFANGIFDRYLNPHIEGAPVGMGLRPQDEDDDEDDDDDDEEDDEDE